MLFSFTFAGAHRETGRIDSPGFPSISSWSGKAMARFFSTSAQWASPSKAATLRRWEFPLLSIFVSSKDLLPDVAMMSLLGTPCFESRCMSLSPNGLHCRQPTFTSTARRLQKFSTSKLAFSTHLHSISLSRSLSGYSCLFSCKIFLSIEVFLSASGSVLSSRASMCQLPGRQKKVKYQ